MGNFARVCRSKQNKSDQRRINYVEDASSEEEESEPEDNTNIQNFTQQQRPFRCRNKNKRRKTKIHHKHHHAIRPENTRTKKIKPIQYGSQA